MALHKHGLIARFSRSLFNDQAQVKRGSTTNFTSGARSVARRPLPDPASAVARARRTATGKPVVLAPDLPPVPGGRAPVLRAPGTKLRSPPNPPVPDVQRPLPSPNQQEAPGAMPRRTGTIGERQAVVANAVQKAGNVTLEGARLARSSLLRRFR